MIIQLEIPKEFAKDYVNNRFDGRRRKTTSSGTYSAKGHIHTATWQQS